MQPEHTIKQLLGKRIDAFDGKIGHVADVYFDDRSWEVRYIVVDTGDWLTTHRVLLPPRAFTNILDTQALQTTLSKKQIQESPPLSEHLPITRQYEKSFYQYYGWPTYWTSHAGEAPPESLTVDPNLLSAQAIIGYTVQATDGDLGPVRDFTVTESCKLTELIVETGSWYAHNPLSLLPSNIKLIDIKRSQILINLSKDDFSQSHHANTSLAG